MQKFSQLFLMKADEAIDQIKDPVERINAIAKLLPYSADVEVPISSNFVKEEFEPNDAVTEAVVPAVTPKKRPGRKPKAEKVAEETSTVVAPAEFEEELEEAITEEEEKEITKEEPVKAETPKPEEIQKVKEAVENIEIKAPSEDDTEEDIAARRAAIVKKYGDKTLEDVYNSEELRNLLAPEIEGVSAFRSFLNSFYGIQVNEDGSEIATGDLNSEEVSNLVQNYILESDEEAEDPTKVKISNFITKALTYLQELYQIYYRYIEYKDVVLETGRNMIDDKEFGLDDVNIYNAGALCPAIEERLQQLNLGE